MKNKSLILFLTSLFFLNLPIHAQADKTFFVGSESLDEIEEPLIEVRFWGWKNPFTMVIYYGQECMDNFGLGGSRLTKSLRENCVGLKDQYGDMVTFNHYMTGLNFLDKQGFDLLEVIPQTDNNFIPSASFILKRRPK